MRRAAGSASIDAAKPAARRTRELAELVATISGRGSAEHRACVGVLEAFAGYARSSPGLGGGTELLR